MARRNVTIVNGISGSGKSTLVNRFLINADLSARFLFDPMPGEFNPKIGEFADRLKLEPAEDPFSLAVGLCRGWAPYDPALMFPGQAKEGLCWFCDWVWEKSLLIPGNKVLVVDEAWLYQNGLTIPLELQTIVQNGRKRGLHLVINTQQPNRLNDALCNGASEVICFKLQSDKALEKVQKEFEFNPEEVAALEPLQFVARNLDSGGELRGKISL